MNFFQNIASFGSSPFRKEEKDSKTQLEELGVNIQEIDNQVQQEAENVEATTFGEQEFFGDVNTIMSDNELDYDTAFDEALKYYKSKNYTIQGVDIDAELGLSQPVQVSNIQDEQTTTKEPETAIGAVLEGSTDKTLESIESFKEGTENVIGGATAQVPAVVSNTASFILDMLQNDSTLNSLSPFKFGLDKMDELAKEKGLPTLAEHLKNDGLDTKESIQENLGVDPEAFTTKAGEFGTEIAATAVGPGGLGLIDDAIKNSPKLIQLAKESPKLFSYLKAAIVGGTETAKFGVVSEGEVTPTGVAVGVVANPVITGVGKFVSGFFNKNIPDLMTKIIKPTAKKGTTPKLIKQDMEIMAGSLKANAKKPQDLETLYTDLQGIQKNLYENNIKPLLAKAGEGKARVNVGEVIDDLLPGLTEKSGVQGKSLLANFGKKAEEKRVNDIIKNLKENFSDINILEAEQIKKFTSAILMGESKTATISQVETKFIETLNKKLGDKIDNVVAGITGTGVKGFKKEYGAIARHLDSLNRRIINEAKASGESLFSGLGKIAGVREIMEGNIVGGTSQIITGEALKLLKDPDEILKKLIKEIYKEPTKKIISNKAIGATSSELGTSADQTQREKVGLE